MEFSVKIHSSLLVCILYFCAICVRNCAGQLPYNANPYSAAASPYGAVNPYSAPQYNPNPFQNQLAVAPPPAPTSGTAKGGFRTAGDLYTLLWEVSQNSITFRAKVQGTGFVGFGISQSGGMKGADVYLAGIHSNGSAYAFDARERNGVAEIDARNDYQLTYATDDGVFTEIHFQRLLDTGDVLNDLPIRNETQYVIWSIGPPSDNLEYHGVGNRGVVRVNLLNQAASGTFAAGAKTNHIY